jgi:predicted nuclease with TOPRIM domain
MFLAQDSGSGGFSDVIKSANPITLAIVGLAAIPMIFYMIRWTLKFQKEFMVYYIKENQDLRERQDGLEAEVQEKDQTIFTLEQEVQTLKLAVVRHEFTIEEHRLRVTRHQKELEHCEETIERLNGIIERRSLDNDDTHRRDDTDRRT